MRVRALQIHNLRIFADASIRPGNGLNLVTGNNGSGKTTLLEAFYFLGRARSFRHRETSPFIRQNSKECRVTTDIDLSSGIHSRLGIERIGNVQRVRHDGKDLHKRSDLFRTMPLHLITPRSHELIERGPDLRRKFIDHGMFHVEHEYHNVLSEYYRSLKQRNAALRQGDSRLACSFDASLVTFGEKISEGRRGYVGLLGRYLRMIFAEMDMNLDIQLEYMEGWSNEVSLDEQLEKQLPRDLKLGYTTDGPHRGDLDLRVESTAASKHLSRGQQKLLVYALKLAQCRIALEAEIEAPILLIDDLSAELDTNNLARVIDQLERLEIQIFITSVSTAGYPEMTKGKLFHVEHGAIQPLEA